MTVLPSMVLNAKTRVGHEALVYYNLENGFKVGGIAFTDDDGVETVQEQACGGPALAALSGGFNALVNNPPNEGEATVNGAFMPASMPLYNAVEIDESSVDITDFTGTGESGDSFEILMLPDPANDVQICFDNGFEMTPGQVVRPIGKKFSTVDHYVRQRPENRLTLTDLVVNNLRGINAIRGRAVTIIVKVFPNGGAVPCEIHYYTNVLAVPPTWKNPSDGNQSVETTIDSMFAYCAIFTGPVVEDDGGS